MAKKNTTTASKSKPKIETDAQREYRWKVEDTLRAMRTLTEAASDKKLMKDVQKAAKEQLVASQKVSSFLEEGPELKFGNE
jgi:hypothetical protein